MTEMFRTLYTNRELIGILVAKQLKLRYRGSVLGFAWTLLNPLLLMLVYTLVFSVYLRVDVEHYPAFMLAGFLPWTWFATSLSSGVTSILEGASLVIRSKFPAVVLPVVALTANTINFILTLPILLVFLAVLQVKMGAALWALVPLIAIEYLFTLGPVLIVSAVNVHYRDFQHIIGHVLTVLQFVTPILYPLALVPEGLRPWTLLNPLTTLVGGFQDVLYWNRVPPWTPLLGLLALSCVILSVATLMFSRYKRSFAEAL